MPILIVCPCASAVGPGTVMTATAAASASARVMRSMFIERYLRNGSRRKRWLNLAHVVSEDYPFTALTAGRRAHGREFAHEAKVPREPPFDLVARDGKRRPCRS